MTPQKLTGFHKFVCFVLIAILVILVIGFAVNGTKTDDNLPGSGDVGNKTDDTDENSNENDTQNNGQAPDNNESDDPSTLPPEIETVIYYNPITGLEVSEEVYNSTPIATVLDPTAPLYGAAESDLVIEFPTETDSSRLLVYNSSEEVLWKIGALSPTRNFISSMSNFFGGIIVSYGEDDVVIYDAWDYEAFFIDISKYKDCCYVENTLYVYTSENMIDLAKSKAGQDQLKRAYKSAPYDFLDDGEVLGTGEVSTVMIPFSESNETELYYHEKTGQYLYYKSGNRKMDMLSGKNVGFTNVFILFANSTTYEKSEGRELVIDTLSGGKGYYISAGKYIEFKWETDVSGDLYFLTLNGERLKVNPGNAYISYVKSSNAGSVKII